jgi:rubrerythrin
MASLKGSKTEDNLKAAFAGESQANRRYLYFAQKADVEGYNDVSAVFRSTAEGETGHAHGHLEYLEEPATRRPGCRSARPRTISKAAVAGETHEYTDMYPGMARTAREEGFDEIADWFETLAKAERSHAGRFQRALDTLWTFSAVVERGGAGAGLSRPSVKARPQEKVQHARRQP